MPWDTKTPPITGGTGGGLRRDDDPAVTPPQDVKSWGGLAARGGKLVAPDAWIASPAQHPFPALPFGNGRSYGDSCLNDGGTLIAGRRLDRILAFDRTVGRVTCEAGVLLDQLLQLVVPAGWFLPVTPGTCLVTVGGALANDVHGKNHHRAGTFGRHVCAFELERSDGSRLTCTPDINAELFAATIGGFGLTGFVSQATLQLIPVASPEMEQETLHFGGLDDFFTIAAESDATHDYTVAWIDSLACGARLGRGVFFRANHAPTASRSQPRSRPSLPFPFTPPIPLINRATMRAFNLLYRHSQPRSAGARRVPYRPFFYPLDRIANWNRAYGPRGLRQFQCAIPAAHAREAVRDLLSCTHAAGEASFLTVLKIFGDVASPGMMSFPLPGATLTLDFANRGARTEKLLGTLDRITLAAGGRVNPYKDARMSAETFAASFPHWRDFARHVDPGFSSNFWRRVMADR